LANAAARNPTLAGDSGGSPAMAGIVYTTPPLCG